MNDVLDPAPLFICELLIVGLEALGDTAADINFRLVIDSRRIRCMGRFALLGSV